MASELAKSADQFKKDLEFALKTNTIIALPTKDAAVKEVDNLKEDAERLASTVGDGRPATGEAKAMLDRAARYAGPQPRLGEPYRQRRRLHGVRSKVACGNGGSVRPASAASVSADRVAAQPSLAEPAGYHERHGSAPRSCRAL